MKRFVCPDCGTAFKYPARRAGKTITCGGCGKPHTLAAGELPVPGAAAPLAGSRRNRVIRYAVIGLLVLGAGAVGLAHFWALKTGADKEAAGVEVERQFGDTAPYALLRPRDARDKAVADREAKVDLDRPGVGGKFDLPGKLLVIDMPDGKLARRITGGLKPGRAARTPEEVTFVAHVTRAERAKTDRGYEFGLTLLVYDLSDGGRLVRVVRFTKTVPEDKPPKELDDGIAAYLNG